MTDWVTAKSCSKGDVVEWFVTAVPVEPGDGPAQARYLYQQIKEQLQTQGAFIFQERIFLTGQAEAILQARDEVLGDWADEVRPSLMVSNTDGHSDLCGIQIHAMAGIEGPQLIKDANSKARGRVIQSSDCRMVGLSGVLPVDPKAGALEQGASMFEQSQSLLTQQETGFLAVPRTWLWLRNILDWYDDLNRARNQYFQQIGLLRQGQQCPMPASTGIGLTPALAQDALCSMDLVALPQSPTPITYLQAGGKQQSAFDYGSAFSRAARAATPGGDTLYISGTASIDEDGKTTGLGDAEAQIRTTLINVKALLTDMDFDEQDVVQVMAYCKTPEVKQVFEAMTNRPDWPWITMICDVCRDNLLFEVEALACRNR